MTKLQLQQENAALRLALEKITQIDPLTVPDSVSSDFIGKLSITIGRAQAIAEIALESH